MLRILANTPYRRLFSAQVVALVGTGLLTVALGLLAYDIAGASAGAVLGTALAIKMVAYVGLAPIAQALAVRLPRRAVMVSLDLIRAAIALALPFVEAIWQIYLLIFLLQAASAAFTPTFQATIPDLLPEEEDYTRALSLSRLAYDLESLLSPLLAAALLTVVSFHVLFVGTVIGFLASALLVLGTSLPRPRPAPPRGVWQRTTRGLRIYLATPRLRALMAINLAVAAAGAMVIVNTVVIVKAGFGLGQSQVALALGAFGGGSMLAALALPRLLDRIPDRPAMLAGAALLAAGAALGSLVDGLTTLCALWAVLGFGYSLAQTPSGRLLRRSAAEEDRPAVFAAQFALSHACWLLAYPLAGWLVPAIGLRTTFLAMAALAAFGTLLATRLWPPRDPDDLVHRHPELRPDHPHLAAHRADGLHHHRYVIDDLHRSWPRHA
ncbi:MAG: MFS transporter [Pseudooceanicola sp.]|nr:MFS transporter [Pseudooceanicola sp.]